MLEEHIVNTYKKTNRSNTRKVIKFQDKLNSSSGDDMQNQDEVTYDLGFEESKKRDANIYHRLNFKREKLSKYDNNDCVESSSGYDEDS